MPRKNLTPLRKADLPAGKRRKTSVRVLNREAKETVQREAAVFGSLMRDVLVRKHLREVAGLPYEPLSVWADLGTFGLPLETSYRDLLRWEGLSRWMKAQAGFFAGIEFNQTHTFSATIHPALERQWAASKKDAFKEIQRLLRRELERSNLHQLPYFYVIEGRTKRGRGKTKLHIHGYCVTGDSPSVTKLKLALERALRMNELTRIERGRGISFQAARYPAVGREKLGGWVGYSLKNVSRREERASRSTFMSNPLTRLAHSFWSLVVEAHFVDQT